MFGDRPEARDLVPPPQLKERGTILAFVRNTDLQLMVLDRQLADSFTSQRKDRVGNRWNRRR